MLTTKSEINYSYATIKLTKGRISKGLIALPKDLSNLFPPTNTTIKVYFDNLGIPLTKKFTSFQSKTHESRIGGMKEWYIKKQFKDGDEIVIQVIDKENFIYRLIPEDRFISTTKRLQSSLDKAKSEEEADARVLSIAQWTEVEKEKAILNEFFRYAFLENMGDRRYVSKRSEKAKETAPNNHKVILGGIYHGLCQVCEFGFLKRDNKPYFELHHINPDKGNHPKNLLVVCANCHRQFEYAAIKEDFNTDGWLIRIRFNRKEFSVKQIALETKFEQFYKQTFIQ